MKRHFRFPWLQPWGYLCLGLVLLAAIVVPAGAQDDGDLPPPCSAVEVPEALELDIPDEPQPLTIFLGFVPNVQFAPLYVAVEKGYFDEAGVDVRFEYGDENIGVERIAANDLQFGAISGEQVVMARAQGLPVVYVFEWYQRFAVGVVALEETGIAAPEDMAGHVIGIPGRYGASWTGFVALLDAVGMAEDDLARIEPIGFAATEAVCAGVVDAAVVYISNEPEQIRATCGEANVIPVADYADLVANGLVTNEQTLAEDPGLVQRVVWAYAQGLADAIADPDEAYRLSRAHVETLPEDDPIQRKVLENSIALWEADLLGYTDPDSWAFTMQTLVDMEVLEAPVDLSGACTNAFVPDVALREAFRFIESVEEAEALLEVPLPADAEDVRFESQNFFGRVLWVGFTVPAGSEALSDFIAALGFEEAPEVGVNPFDCEDVWGWWQPRASETFAGASRWDRGDAQPKRQLNLLIDQTDPARWTVYLRLYDDL